MTAGLTVALPQQPWSTSAKYRPSACISGQCRTDGNDSGLTAPSVSRRGCSKATKGSEPLPSITSLATWARNSVRRMPTLSTNTRCLSFPDNPSTPNLPGPSLALRNLIRPSTPRYPEKVALGRLPTTPATFPVTANSNK